MKIITATLISLLFISETAGAQGVSYEQWPGATLADPQDLANVPLMLGIPQTSSVLQNYFEVPLNVNVAGGKFVARLMAKIVPPVSGSYYFWLSANQKAKLWISPDTPNFVGRAPICKITLSPPPSSRQWTKYAEQRSAAISLVGGRTYYLMVVQTEQDSDGINHASVGWMIPPATSPIYERPIPATRLMPASYDITLQFSVNPTQIVPGQSAQLSWTTTFASSCVASSLPEDPSWLGSKPVSGTQTIMPAQNTTYSISCTSLDGGIEGTSVIVVVNRSELTLAWDPSTSTIAGYKIYMGTSTRTYGFVMDVGNVTQITIGSGQFPSSGTYYFAVTCYDGSGESSYSNEVYATITVL